jgi:AcrR family transcriptional regulator
MSPRPRKASDEEVFGAAHRVISRLGPAQWTLADIAAEAGLTAGALVQRFGSKRELMIALTAGAASGTPLDALVAYADCIARMGESPAALAHHLGYLQLDLTDPELHRHVREQARATRAEIRALLDDAVTAGELRAGTDTAGLARVVEVTLSGSLMTWAFYQEGPVVEWIRQDLENVLRVWRPVPAVGTRRTPARKRPPVGGV